MHSISLSYRSP